MEGKSMGKRGIEKGVFSHRSLLCHPLLSAPGGYEWLREWLLPFRRLLWLKHLLKHVKDSRDSRRDMGKGATAPRPSKEVRSGSAADLVTLVVLIHRLKSVADDIR